jgi:hypothetical protein
MRFVSGCGTTLRLLHTSHVTRHTSHVTRHTPHATRHTSHAIAIAVFFCRIICRVDERRPATVMRLPRIRRCHSLPPCLAVTAQAKVLHRICCSRFPPFSATGDFDGDGWTDIMVVSGWMLSASAAAAVEPVPLCRAAVIIPELVQLQVAALLLLLLLFLLLLFLLLFFFFFYSPAYAPTPSPATSSSLLPTASPPPSSYPPPPPPPPSAPPSPSPSPHPAPPSSCRSLIF